MKKIINLLMVAAMMGLVVRPVLTMAENEATSIPETVEPATTEAPSIIEEPFTEPESFGDAQDFQATSTPEFTATSTSESTVASGTESTATSIPESPATSTPESVATSTPNSVATTTPESAVISTPESVLGAASEILAPEEAVPTTTPGSAEEQNFSSLPASFSEVVDTGFTTGGAGAGAPVVQAIWEMSGTAEAALGTDDRKDSGAQFLPSGQYRVSKPYSVCMAVADLNGASDIMSGEVRVTSPQAAYYEETEEGELVCGLPKGTLKAMTPLAKEKGISLFCGSIKNSNANLPAFYGIYNFKTLCGEAGDLERGKAAIYCADIELAYDDAAGQYSVAAVAKDTSGAKSNILENSFSYLELTAFETDFSSLDYGNVELNELETVLGDAEWQELKVINRPTVRNVGNTRLKMSVTQNDMGLGKTDGEWNIRYGFKVGAESLWASYWPEEEMVFEKAVELSEAEPISFALTVLNFSEDREAYSGTMTLTAHKAETLTCD